MSSGQKPRWPAYFPRMKERGKYRQRRARIVVWSSDFKPVWPPVLHVDGVTIRVDRGTFRVGGRVLNQDTSLWEDASGLDIEITTARIARDSGARHDLADVAAELGIDLDEEAA